MPLPLGFALSAAFIVGVAAAASGLFLPLLVFMGAAFLGAWAWNGGRATVILGAAVLLAVTLGYARVAEDDGFPPAPAELETARSFSGRVLDVPRHFPDASYARVKLSDPVDALVWTTFPPFPAVQQGDQVNISGSFRSHEDSHPRGFASQRGTTGRLNARTVQITGNQASNAQRARSFLAGEIKSRMQQRIPEPAGAFATGVLLGDDGAMTSATRHSFRVGGMTHMTAVSGVHVGIIAAAILLLSRVGLVHRWVLLVGAIPLIWSFAYLVGMRPSVVRASLMLTLLLVAQLLGRPRDTLNAVGLAAALMILFDPAIRYDIGFQLSVAATIGIAVSVLLIGSRSHWHLVWAVPVAAQVSTEPLILYNFGYYSLVSPLANIVAIPFLAITMAMSILTVLGSLVSDLLADALALGTWVPSYAIVLIADMAASVPYLSGDVTSLSLRGVWIAYAVIVGVAAVFYVLTRPSEKEADVDVSLLYRV